jgi:hypothetical protein
MIFRRFAILAPLGIVACVPAPTPAPVPRPSPPVIQPAPKPPAAPAANWSDRAPAPGVWTYMRDGRGSIARFGPAGSDALFTIRCEATGARIFVSRPGSAPAKMTLRSTNGAKAYDALPTSSTPPYVAAEVAARDAQLDAMAFSRGRILIGLDGAGDLILPIWPEFTRVVEDCRG